MEAQNLIQVLKSFGYKVVNDPDDFKRKSDVILEQNGRLTGLYVSSTPFPLLTHEEIKIILKEFSSQLKYLFLNEYRSDILEGLKFPALEYLSIDSPEITYLDFLHLFPRLKHLEISLSSLKTLKGIENLEFLECLEIYGSQLRSLRILKKLKNLRCLKLTGDFSRNKDWSFVIGLDEFSANFQLVKNIPLDFLQKIKSLDITRLDIESPVQMNELNILQKLAGNIRMLSLDISPVVKGLHLKDVLEKLPYPNNIQELEIFAHYDEKIQDFIKEGRTKDIEAEDLSLISKKFKRLKSLVLLVPFVKDFRPLEKLKSLQNLTLILSVDFNVYKTGFKYDHSLSFVKSLHNLKRLTLDGVGVLENLDFLKNANNLESLSFFHLAINSLKGIENLQKLKELGFHSVSLPDVNGIGKLKNLEKLSFQICVVDDLDGLKSLTRLKELYLLNNGFCDFSFLLKMKNLEVLHSAGNYICDFSVLENLSKLRVLNITNTEEPYKFKNVKVLEKLQALTNLELKPSAYDIDDFAIDKLKNLVSLRLSRFVNTSRLSKLYNLRELELTDIDVEDVKFVENLKNLVFLDIATTRKTSLKPLKNLQNLIQIYLDEIDARELENLLGLKNLEVLFISDMLNQTKAKEVVRKLRKFF